MKDNNSLAHSTWNCKYHLVFAPKYRRMQIYGQGYPTNESCLIFMYSFDIIK